MNSYCGPAAYALLTGTTPDEGARAIRAVTGRAKVHGTNNGELVAALRAAGLTVEPFGILVGTSNAGGQRPTLQAWYALQPRSGTYLVNITGHYVVMRGGKLYDNKHMYGMEFPWVCETRRKRVLAAWRVEG